MPAPSSARPSRHSTGSPLRVNRTWIISPFCFVVRVEVLKYFTIVYVCICRKWRGSMPHCCIFSNYRILRNTRDFDICVSSEFWRLSLFENRFNPYTQTRLFNGLKFSSCPAHVKDTYFPLLEVKVLRKRNKPYFCHWLVWHALISRCNIEFSLNNDGTCGGESNLEGDKR